MSQDFDTWLRLKIRDVMRYGPTKPPYRVKAFNEIVGSFYVSAADCNVLGAASFLSREVADQVAEQCNLIAAEYRQL